MGPQSQRDDERDEAERERLDDDRIREAGEPDEDEEVRGSSGE